MCIEATLMGTLLSVLLFVIPVNYWQSEKQLVEDSNPVIMVDYAVGSSATAIIPLALPAEMIQVGPCYRVRENEVREDEGNVSDGYIRQEPAPT